MLSGAEKWGFFPKSLVDDKQYSGYWRADPTVLRLWVYAKSCTAADIGSIHLNGCSYFNKSMTVGEGKLADQFLRCCCPEIAVPSRGYTRTLVLLWGHSFHSQMGAGGCLDQAYTSQFFLSTFFHWTLLWLVMRMELRMWSQQRPWGDFFPFLSLRFEITAFVSSQHVQALTVPELSLLPVFTSSSHWSWVRLHTGCILWDKVKSPQLEKLNQNKFSVVLAGDI